MIVGKKFLQQKYINLEENQYQPAGIDLTLDDVAILNHNSDTIYGIFKDSKVLPGQIPLNTTSMMVGGSIKEVFLFDPLTSYIVTTKEKVKISQDVGQFYLPRSSLLRSGITIETAFGDPGFHGHLSFLLINTSKNLFAIEKGARFAQLVEIEAKVFPSSSLIT